MDYEKFRLQVRDLATKAYKDLKEESKDYGELRQKCIVLKYSIHKGSKAISYICPLE